MVLPGETGLLRRMPLLTAQQTAQLAAYANQGAQMAAMSPQLQVARAASDDPEYRKGFDVGSAVGFGKSLPGPNQNAVRDLLYAGDGVNIAQRGFDVAEIIQYGITKTGGDVSQNHNVAVGQLVVTGAAGSGLPSNVKAGAVQAVTANNPLSREGAKAQLEKHLGIFTRIKRFFFGS